MNECRRAHRDLKLYTEMGKGAIIFIRSSKSQKCLNKRLLFWRQRKRTKIVPEELRRPGKSLEQWGTPVPAGYTFSNCAGVVSCWRNLGVRSFMGCIGRIKGQTYMINSRCGNLGRIRNVGRIGGYFQNLATFLASIFTLLFTMDNETRRLLLRIFNKIFLIT